LTYGDRLLIFNDTELIYYDDLLIYCVNMNGFMSTVSIHSVFYP